MAISDYPLFTTTDTMNQQVTKLVEFVSVADGATTSSTILINKYDSSASVSTWEYPNSLTTTVGGTITFNPTTDFNVNANTITFNPSTDFNVNANTIFGGAITMPSQSVLTTAKDVAGAINELRAAIVTLNGGTFPS